MPSLLSFRYERRSVRSRGRGESPAAWRDPVAFENGTRPDTRLSAPWSSRGKNKGRESTYTPYLHHYSADSNKRASIPLVDKAESDRSAIQESSVACGVA